jgi:hypothetical protein
MLAIKNDKSHQTPTTPRIGCRVQIELLYKGYIQGVAIKPLGLFFWTLPQKVSGSAVKSS